MASFLDQIPAGVQDRCRGVTFVITGAVNVFKNRNEFVAYVVSQGGSVSGSVSAKTDYLVNNNIDSTSTKNRKAKELGIPIITEEMFIEKFASAPAAPVEVQADSEVIPAEARAKIEAEMRAKIEAEMRAKLEAEMLSKVETAENGDHAEEIPSPRKEYLRMLALAGEKDYLPKREREWLYSFALDNNAIALLSSDERSNVNAYTLSALIADYRYEEAEALTNELLSNNHLPAKAYGIVGDYYTKTRRYDKAQDVLEKGIREYSADEDVIRNLKERILDNSERKKKISFSKPEYFPKPKENPEFAQERYINFLKTLGIEVTIPDYSVKKTAPKPIPYDVYPDIQEIRNANFDTFVAFSFETTGLDPIRDSIIQVGAVKVIHGEVKAEECFNEFVKPYKQIVSEKVADITGIHQEDVQNAREMWEVIPDFLKFVGDNNLVGYNSIDFDAKFLSRAGRYSNIVVENQVFDVMRYASTLRYQLGLEKSRIKLSDLAKKLDVADYEKRSAYTKACRIAEVFLKLKAIDLKSSLGNDELIAQYKRQADELHVELKEKQDGLRALEGEIRKLLSEKSQIESDTDALRIRRDNCEKQMSSLSAEASVVQEKVNSLQNKKGLMQKELDGLSFVAFGKKKELKAGIEECDASIKTAITQLDQIRKSLADINKTDLLEEISQKEAEIAQYSSLLVEKQKLAAETEQLCASLKNELEAKQENIAKIESTIGKASLKTESETEAIDDSVSNIAQCIAQLEQYYPEHKVFALDSISSSLRNALKVSAQKEGYATLEELLGAYGFEMISADKTRLLRNKVIYAPGDEPDFMRTKVESVLRRLEEYYPNHIIEKSIQSEHKNLSQDISGLYQWFGYVAAGDFLNAYGYTYTVREYGDADDLLKTALDKLESYYPEHKVFALDSIDGGLRARLNKLSKEFGYASTTELMNAKGFEIISTEEAKKLRDRVLYTPGNEPDVIKTKVAGILKRLNEKYPDHIVPLTFQAEEKTLAGDLSGLYQWLGYANYWAFMKAYSYKVDSISPRAMETLAQIDPEEGIIENLSFMNVQKAKGGSIYIARALACDSEVIVPLGIDSISSSAFAEQRELEKVIIKANITTIPAKAFQGCRSLKQVLLPDSVTEIQAEAFADCPALQQVMLPQHDVTMADNAFRNSGFESAFLEIQRKKEADRRRLEEEQRAEKERLSAEKRAKQEEERQARLAAEEQARLEAEQKRQEREAEREAARIRKEEQRLSARQEHSDAVMARRFARLERYYPEHKVFALDSIASDLREALTISAQKEGYATLEEMLGEYGFEMISAEETKSIRNKVIYAPGNEPDFMRAKVESVLRRLEGHYPNHIIEKSIQSEHKNLSQDISGLYQWFGYASAGDFLNAYGYTYMVKDGAGRPSNDYEGVIQQLIEKYKNTAKPKNMGALFFENPELKGQLKTLQNRSGELFGMSLKKYLEQIGLFAEKASSPSSRSSAAGVREEVERSLRALYSTLDESKYGTIDAALESLIGLNVKQKKNGEIYIFRATDCGSEVTIPYGVNFLSEGAFKGCDSLEKITILADLREIPAEAFYGCTALSHVVLPDTLQLISSDAFAGCSSLKEIDFRNAHPYVDPSAFRACPYEYVPEKNDDEADAELFKFTKDRSNHATITGTEDLPSDLEVLTIPKFLKGCIVTAIGEDAFKNCRYLVEVSMPDTITSLQRGAFRDCISLKKIHLSENIEKLVTTTFSGCIGLKEVNIPDGVTELKKGTFRDSPLENLHIGKNLSMLDATAFYKSEKSEHTGKTASSRRIGTITIDPENPYLTSSDSLIFSKDGTQLLVSLGSKGAMRIPEGVVTICDYAFNGLSGLTDVTLPDSLLEIGCGTFASTGLRSIQIGKNVKTIKSEAFMNCEYLTSAIFNEVITSIGDKAFYNSPVTEVWLPQTLQTLGKDSFDCLAGNYSYGNKQMLKIDSGNPYLIADGTALYAIDDGETVLQRLYKRQFREYDYSNNNALDYTVKDGTVRIADGACEGCFRLGTVDLPEGLKSIGSNAFNRCDALKTINLPDSLEEIGETAFFGSAVKSLQIGPNVREIGSGALVTRYYSNSYSSSYNSVKKLTVDPGNPHFFVENSILYKRTPEGLTVISIIGRKTHAVIHSDTTSIAEDAFMYSSVEEVYIPASVKEIGKNAFKGCDNLLRLKLEIVESGTSQGTAVVYIPEIKRNDYYGSSAHDQYMDCIRIDGQGTLFDFVKYDSLFKTISKAKDKVLVAIDRLKSAFNLVPLYRENYLTYLRRNSKKAVEITTEFDDLDGLNTLAELGVFTGENIDGLIELANKSGNVGVISYLMNYKNAEIGTKTSILDQEFEL